MARNVIDLDVPPERVWEVLADPRCYPRWVVGAKRFRDADPDFPAVGTKFHHEVGIGPITIQDHTEVLEVDPPRMIRLRAKARPLLAAEVLIEVEARGKGSRVTMMEEPVDPITKHLPPVHWLVHARNNQALQRFRAIAERPPVRRGAKAARAGR